MARYLQALFMLSIFAQSISAREIRDLNAVYKEITDRNLTMVTRERFDTIDIISEYIKEHQIPGDIIECGCWRGGMSIYLAYSFPNKKCWVSDSFHGFETLDECKYDPRGIVDERHHSGNWIVPESEVRQSFAEMGLTEACEVEFLSGWVNDTTDPSICPVKELALLRIDVDAYSATLVVLENLYDKVVPGGFIIFDDSGLYETVAAMEEFEKRRGVPIISKLMDPHGRHLGKITGEHGLYLQK
jgi:O-methyltransferase